MAQAEAIRYGLLDGNEPDFWWLYTADFDHYVKTWSAVAQMADGDLVDVSVFRDKMIETMWRPR